MSHAYAEDMCMANDYAAQNALDAEPMLTCIPIYKYANNKKVTFLWQNKQQIDFVEAATDQKRQIKKQNKI